MLNSRKIDEAKRLYNKHRDKIGSLVLADTGYKTRNDNGVYHINKNRPSMVPVTLGTGTGKTTMVTVESLLELKKMEDDDLLGVVFFLVHKVMQAKEIPNDKHIMKVARKNRISVLHNPAIDDFIDVSFEVASVITESQFHSHDEKDERYGACSLINLEIFLRSLLRDNKSIVKKLDYILYKHFEEKKKKDDEEGVDEDSDFYFKDKITIEKFLKSLWRVREKAKELEDNSISEDERSRLEKELSSRKAETRKYRRQIAAAFISTRFGIYGIEKENGYIEEDCDLKKLVKQYENLKRSDYSQSDLDSAHNDVIRKFMEKAFLIKDRVYGNRGIFKRNENGELLDYLEVVKDSEIKTQDILWIILSVIEPSGIAQFSNSLVIMTHKKSSQKAPLIGINKRGVTQNYNLHGVVNHLSPRDNYSSVIDAVDQNDISKMIVRKEQKDILFPVGDKKAFMKIIIDEYPTYDSGEGKDNNCIEAMEHINNDDNVKYVSEAIRKYKIIANKAGGGEKASRIVKNYTSILSEKMDSKGAIENNHWYDIIEKVVPCYAYVNYIYPTIKKCIMKDFHYARLIEIDRDESGEIILCKEDEELVHKSVAVFEEAVKYGWENRSSRSDISMGLVDQEEIDGKTINKLIIKNETTQKEYYEKFHNIKKSLDTINKTTPYPSNLGAETNSNLGILISEDSPCVMEKKDIIKLSDDENVKKNIDQGVPTKFKSYCIYGNLFREQQEIDVFFMPFSLIGAFFALGVIEPCLIALALDLNIISKTTMNTKIKNNDDQKNGTMYKFARSLLNGKVYDYILKSFKYIYDPKFFFEDDEEVTTLQGHGLPLLLISFAPTDEYKYDEFVRNVTLGIKVGVHIRFMSSQLYVYSLSKLPRTQVVLLSATMGYKDCREGEIIDIYRKFNNESYKEGGERVVAENEGLHIITHERKKEIIKNKQEMEQLSLGHGHNPVYVTSRKISNGDTNVLYDNLFFSIKGFNTNSWSNSFPVCGSKIKISDTSVISDRNSNVRFMDRDFIDNIPDLGGVDLIHYGSKEAESNEYGIFLSKTPASDSEMFNGEFNSKRFDKFRELGSMNFVDFNGGDDIKNIKHGFENSAPKLEEMFSSFNELFISSNLTSSKSPFASIFLTRSGRPGKYIMDCIIYVCSKLTGVNINDNSLFNGDQVENIKKKWREEEPRIREEVYNLKSRFENSEKNDPKKSHYERAFVSARALYRMAAHYIYNLLISCSNKDYKIVKDSILSSMAVPVELFSYKNAEESEKIYKKYGPCILINFKAASAKKLDKDKDIFRIYNNEYAEFQSEFGSGGEDKDKLSELNFQNIIPMLFTAYKSGGEAFNLMARGVFYRRICLISNPFYSVLSSVLDYIKYKKIKKDNGGDDNDSDSNFGGSKSAIIADNIARYCGENSCPRTILKGIEEDEGMITFLETEHCLNILKTIFQATGRGERSVRTCDTEISISDNKTIPGEKGFYEKLMNYLYIYIQKEIGDGLKLNRMLDSENFFGTSLFTKALLITSVKKHYSNIEMGRVFKEEDYKVLDDMSRNLDKVDKFIYGYGDGGSYIASLINIARGENIKFSESDNIIAAMLCSILRVDIIDNAVAIPDISEKIKQWREDSVYDNRNTKSDNFKEYMLKYPISFMKMIIDEINKYHMYGGDIIDFIKNEGSKVYKNDDYVDCDLFDLLKKSKEATSIFRYLKNESGCIIGERYNKKEKRFYYGPFSLQHGSLYVNKLEVNLMELKRNFKYISENMEGSLESDKYHLKYSIASANGVIEKLINKSLTDFTGIGQSKNIIGNIAENIVRIITDKENIEFSGFLPFEKGKRDPERGESDEKGKFKKDESDPKIFRIGDVIIDDEKFLSSFYELGDRLFYNKEKNRLISLDVKNFSSKRSYDKYHVKEDIVKEKERKLEIIMSRFIEKYGDELGTNRDEKLSVGYKMVNVNPNDVSVNSKWHNCPSLFAVIPPKYKVVTTPKRKIKEVESEKFTINPLFLEIFDIT